MSSNDFTKQLALELAKTIDAGSGHSQVLAIPDNTERAFGLIGPIILRKKKAPSILLFQGTNNVRDFYLAQGYLKPPRAQKGRAMSIPRQEVNSTAKLRLSKWFNRDSAKHREECAAKLLFSIHEDLFVKQNQMVMHFLREVANKEQHVKQWPEDELEIIGLLERGRNLVLSDTHYTLAYELRQAFSSQIIDHIHAEEEVGLLYCGHINPGFWSDMDEPASMFAWCDAKELTFGISAFMMRGIGVHSTKELWSIVIPKGAKLSDEGRRRVQKVVGWSRAERQAKHESLMEWIEQNDEPVEATP